MEHAHGLNHCRPIEPSLSDDFVIMLDFYNYPTVDWQACPDNCLHIVKKQPERGITIKFTFLPAGLKNCLLPHPDAKSTSFMGLFV
jgi:hypothetical protein